MPDDSPPPHPSQGTLLSTYRLAPKKSFGQNFLHDVGVCRRIAELCTTPPGGTVIELGAGLGALTHPLLERGARVLAVERDRDLVPVLETTFAAAREAGQLTVLEADAKQIDVSALLAGDAPRPHVLAGNLPYQLTGPLLELAVHSGALLQKAVFLVQLEVAERISATPGSDAWGALSVFVQARFHARRAFVVKRGAFIPPPNVDSAVVELTTREVPLAEETELFRRVVKGAFSQRRKKLKSAWASLAEPSVLQAAAAEAGVDLELRGEVLPVERLAAMALALGAR